jgi:hypothetical protein
MPRSLPRPECHFQKAREEAPPVISPQQSKPQNAIVEVEPGNGLEAAEVGLANKICYINHHPQAFW